MASNKLGMVGLAVRAGKALFGTAACERGVKNRSVRLLLLQEGLSAPTRKNFEGLCRRANVRFLTVNGQGALGAAIGKPGIMILGITDSGFAGEISDNFDGGSGTE